MLIYINGKFHPKEEAKVSVFDHGYLYGDGIYETLRAYGGFVFELSRHMERLFKSAERMELNLPFGSKEIHGAIYNVLKVNRLKDAYVRVSVSRGPGEIGLDPELCPQPTVVIIAKEFKPYPEEFYTKGVMAAVVKTLRNPPGCIDPAVKSTNFLNNIFAKMEAKRAGAFEGIMLNMDGFLAEGTVSNVFIVEGGTVVTPPLAAGILEGVTRDVVIAIARRLGLGLKEDFITKDRLYQADEVFLTNTTVEVLPVTRVDGRVIADGVPGVVTKRLLEAYTEEVVRCSEMP